MRILIAPDKFKDSLTADEVIMAIKKGIRKVLPNAKIHEAKMSDGGDGFLNAVNNYLQCKEIWVATEDPLGRPIKAPYLLDTVNGRAYIELAKASGLELLKPLERNVMITSTRGTGLQMLDAIKKGAKTLYLGLGGSATNDGGTGIADALGYVFKDKNDNPLRPMGVNLSKIHRILMPKDGLLDTIKVIAINDVGNPLHGKQGAAYVYGAQKGANKEQIVLLDTGLRHLAERVRTSFEKSFERLPGSGAAGGTAYGLKVFLNAEYTRGIDFVLGIAGVETLMKSHVIDYIFTGEGKIDQQTVYGKLIKGVADLGSEHDIPVIAVCGKLDMDTKGLDVLGLTQVLEIMDTSKPVQYSMDNAAEMVEQKVRQYLIDAVQDNY